MALAPADFYAYSRATGVPVPEDPEERAEMAPEVAEFRRNQLKAPSQEGNLLQTLGLAALGLGAAAGIGFGAKRMLRPKAPASLSATAGVRQGNIPTAEAVKAVQTIKREAPNVPPPSKVAAIPQATVDLGQTIRRSVMPTEEESFAQYNRQLQNLIPEPTETEIDFSEVPVRYTQASPRLGYSPIYRPDPKDINEALLGPISEEVAAARREAATQNLLSVARRRQELATTEQQTVANSLTQIQDSQTPNVVNQFKGAVESGEDQITGRIMQGVQRNEDLDSSQINQLAVQTNSAQVAASTTPDGIPFDQTKDFEILGRFPGPEGSSAFNVEYTPVEARYQGRPVRYERLPVGGLTEGESAVSPLLTEGQSKYAAYGLSAPKTHVIPEDVATLMQQTFKKQGNKLETHQRQALDLFETTGDPNYLAAAFGSAPAMAYQGRLPGGEVVQTKEFYIPIGERINPETGKPVVETRLEALSRVEGPEGIRSRVREQTMQQIERMTGVRPVMPSAQQLETLPTVNKRAERLAQRDVDEATARYQQAQDFAVNYALRPEAKRGVYLSPQFEVNPLTGKENFIGMIPQVEQETIATPALYQMRSSSGASRIDLGGIGRRREALESQGFFSFSEDPLAFLYKDVDTGELVEPGAVSRQDVDLGKYTPVRGTAVEPQRILGSEGRTFKGVSAAEIDPRSFDPGTRQELARQYPERVTPEGLIYSEQAMLRPSEAQQYGKKYATQPPTINAKEALNVSLEYDRLRRSGVPGAAEAFIDKIKQEKGVSALGPSMPLRQKINRQGRFTV